MSTASITLERYGLPTGIYRLPDGNYDMMPVIEVCKGLLQDFALSASAPVGTKENLYRSNLWNFSLDREPQPKTFTACYNQLKKFADLVPRIKGQEIEVDVGDLPPGWTSVTWENSATFESCPAVWAPTFTGGMHKLSTVKVIYRKDGVTRIAQATAGAAGLINLKRWEGLPVSLMRTTTPVLTPVVGEIDVAELESVIHRLYLACMDCGCFVPKEEVAPPGGAIVIKPPHPRTPSTAWSGSPSITVRPGEHYWDDVLDRYLANTRLDIVHRDDGTQVSYMQALGLDKRTFLVNVGALELLRQAPAVVVPLAGGLAAFQRFIQDPQGGQPMTKWDLVGPTLEYTHASPLLIDDNGGIQEGYRYSQAAKQAVKFLNENYFRNDGVFTIFLPYVYVGTQEELQALKTLKLGTREGLKAAFESGKATVVAVEYMYTMARKTPDAASTHPRLMAMPLLNLGLVPIRAVNINTLTF